MITNIIKISALVLVVLLNACKTEKSNTKENDSPIEENLYFGQKEPSLIPEIFAPEIISITGRYEYGIAFSPDFTELYYSASKKDSLPGIYFSKLENGEWTNPKKTSFTKGVKEAEMHPFVSYDGSKIYFTAHSPDYTDTKIWYVSRSENFWNEAIKMKSPLNNDEVFYLNQSKKGDFFYTNISKSKIYTAKINDGINDAEIEFGFHGFISPNQDFLVLNARNKEDSGRKDNDIYVCFIEKDHTWTKPINLGNKINTEFDETCPSLTPDGKYLFFSRYNEEDGLSNFYWVSTGIIESLRPKQ